MVIRRSRIVRAKTVGLAAGWVRDAGAEVEDDEQTTHLLVHVTQRQDGEEAAGRVAGYVLRYSLYVGGEVAVGQHDALGVARGPGGEHDLGEVVGLDVHRLRLRQPVEGGFQLLERQLGGAELYAVLGGESRREDQPWLRLGQHPLDVVRRAAEVQGDYGCSRPQASEEGQHPLGAVRTPEDHPVTLAYAPALKQRSDLPGLTPQPSVAPSKVAKARFEQKGVSVPVLVDLLSKKVDHGLADPCAASECMGHGLLPISAESLTP